MPETYTVYTVAEQGAPRKLFMGGVEGKDVVTAAFRIRRSGEHPVVISERDGQRIYC